MCLFEDSMCLSRFLLCVVIYKSQLPAFVSRFFQRNDDLCSFRKATRWPAIRGNEWGAFSGCTTHNIITVKPLQRFKNTFFFVSQGEKIVYEYFSDPEFIDQLIEFLSLEERKGKDSFNPRRFCLFKVQFKFSCCDDMTSLFFDKEVTQRTASHQGWTQESCNFFHHLLWFIVLCQKAVHLHQPNGCNLSFSEEKKSIFFYFFAEWTFTLMLDLQGLFRNYGDVFLPLLWPHLERLASDPHESSQRCVCEITAGLIRGSKHWSFSEVLETHTHQKEQKKKKKHSTGFLIRKVNINKKLSLLLVFVCLHACV